ncbi:hypothetical protein OCAR_7757 [Afipia carboxidovorans OM5]|uniref:hypothetical protein n=1 Tax=Afipia carboxidovorans TaxID=40137 RepID=UPI0001737950|nr:hypothetical protein [Afipia carboxidovorans]ACI94853.1 hypothetical protein OCAR_7757 [Afipia carboxidovorans OM5]
MSIIGQDAFATIEWCTSFAPASLVDWSRFAGCIDQRTVYPMTETAGSEKSRLSLEKQ